MLRSLFFFLASCRFKRYVNLLDLLTFTIIRLFLLLLLLRRRFTPMPSFRRHFAYWFRFLRWVLLKEWGLRLGRREGLLRRPGSRFMFRVRRFRRSAFRLFLLLWLGSFLLVDLRLLSEKFFRKLSLVSSDLGIELEELVPVLNWCHQSVADHRSTGNALSVIEHHQVPFALACV